MSLAGQFINLSSSWQYEEEVPSPGIYYIGYAIAPSGSNIGNISGWVGWERSENYYYYKASWRSYHKIKIMAG